MDSQNSQLNKYSLWLSHIICAVIVFLTAWPILKNPRLEADDYRYLHHVQQFSAGKISAVEMMTVENRWDHLWFMQETGKVRFFRPTVVLSYAADWAVWGDKYEFGLTLTNVAIHLFCCLLVGWILHRLIPGLPAVLSAALFAGLAAHAESIWYIAGRTDSLAALGFFAAFSLHIYGRRKWALLFFVLGFLTKELVIVAPAVFWAYDRWVGSRKTDWRLFGMYGICAVGILLLKKLALDGQGSDFVTPYLISPLSAEFLPHLLLQLKSYTGNLLAAEITVPFADAETVNLLHRPVFLYVGIALFFVSSWLLRKDRRFWLLCLFGFLTWLPTSFVYLSERYLYLPSFAFVGLLGLLLQRRRDARVALSSNGEQRGGGIASTFFYWILCGLFSGYVFFHSINLHRRHAELAHQPGSVREMIRQVEPVKTQIENSGRILLVNTPGEFVRAQFAQDIFRVVFNRPDLLVEVLTMMPGQNGTEWKPGDAYPLMGAGVMMEKKQANQFVLIGRVLKLGMPANRVQEYGPKAFNWSPLIRNARYSTETLNVWILSDDAIGATSIDFTLLDPAPKTTLLVWNADYSDLNEHPWIRRQNAKVESVSL